MSQPVLMRYFSSSLAKKKHSYHDLCFDVSKKVEWSRISERRLVKSHILK